ncbi:hypothetical protein [Pelagimonas phthalicica]|uniref:hypothetical protein n=1 Tax=Pelagimonas phthalicica TaxID=1037362 RepID=UPI00105CF326|nr:hypothetical protein [Pelagimonas phthalicica]
MAELLELVVSLLAVGIYGTEDRPRHPIWRNSIRTIAFAGLLVSVADVLGILGSVEFPFVVTLVWAFCSLIVITAEYYVGSKRVCLAAYIAYPIWLAILIYSER